MKESITIKNLGPLKDIEIHDIKPFTVLIGESGNGKSLLMKVLVLFRYIYKMLNIRWYLKNSNVKKSRFKLSMDNLLSPELKQYFTSKDLEIHYTVEINGNNHGITYRNGTLERNTIDRAIPNADLIFLKESWISEMRNIIPEWVARGNEVKKNTLRTRTLDFYFQETYNDFYEATDTISKVDMRHVGLEMNVERKGKEKKFMIRPLDNSYRPLELKYGSSGAQTSASIMTLIEYFSTKFSFKDAIGRSIINYLYETNSLTQYKPELEPMDMRKLIQIHIEEPELNLFPDAQCRLIEGLVRKSFQSNEPDRELRLILATHSPYIVNYLNVLLNRTASDKASVPASDMAVYRIYDGRLQSLLGTAEDGSPLVNTYDLTEQMQLILQEYNSLV